VIFVAWLSGGDEAFKSHIVFNLPKLTSDCQPDNLPDFGQPHQEREH
jgi:hypothetical protein